MRTQRRFNFLTMRLFHLAAALALFILATPVNAQKQIGGISIPTSLSIGELKLQLNGAGIREKLWFDLYVGGLYLQEKSSDADKIMAADEEMAIKMHIISDMITEEKMVKATLEGFKKSTGGNMEPLQEKIDRFIDLFRTGIEVGHVYNFVYLPSQGVKVYKNKKLHDTIPGLEFKKALFGIWLCNQPPDADLREGMLGLE